MPIPTGVSRRIEQCITHIQHKDWEGALVNLFPTIDKTAKRRRPKEGVGNRIKAFLEDEEGLISCIAIGGYMTGIYVDGISLTDVLYKFGRTSITHEGELDPRLNFNEKGRFTISNDRWDLPVEYIFALSVAVIVAPENVDEKISKNLQVLVLGERFQVNKLWGQRQFMRKSIEDKFRQTSLFQHEA